MNRIKALLSSRTLGLGFELAGLLLSGFHASAQSVQHLSLPQPGGMPGLPVMTGIQRTTNGLAVTWDGPAGYYGLFQELGIRGAKWQILGKATNLVRRAAISPTARDAFFRIEGPAPQYAGAQTCEYCHTNIYIPEIRTPHAAAFTNAVFVAQGGQTNVSCLPSHTVGYGLPTGFISQTKTPLLEGVQCENCHGPAAPHAANPDDPISVPRIEVASAVCGGCHAGTQQPIFEDWQTSAHAGVVEDLNAVTNQMCLSCHSGSVRLSLLTGIPLVPGDANIGIVCATCHDPHQTNGNPAQLRNPVASTNDYFADLSGTFASQYQPAINLCAQCHNHAGANWTNSSAPPHHSPQYNVLLGTVGELPDGLPPNQPAAHALQIANQCVGCHMQTTNYMSQAQPAITGHSFNVELYNVCANCHSLPEPLLQFVTNAVSSQVMAIKGSLYSWATNAAPKTLLKYGPLAWEYTAPGDLSTNWFTKTLTNGPNASEQALIPVNIQKARFNLYLVAYDGSFGVHNGPFCINLLNAAQDWIDAELNP